MLSRSLMCLLMMSVGSGVVRAESPLHKRIDALIRAGAGDAIVSPPADDTEFLRRAYLDFAGRIPTADEARAFLDDTTPEKRTKLINQLFDDPAYPIRMGEMFHVMFMERLGDHPQWEAYLQKCFEENRPWDRMAREILAARPDDENAKGAAFFITKRLENIGQNPVDHPGLARDLGRLFLGKDLQCAQCHDHLFIDDYTQRDFQGMFAFIQNLTLDRNEELTIVEKPTTEKIEFASVFIREKMETGPRVPGLDEIPIPALKDGEEYLVPPDRKTREPGVPRVSMLVKLSETLPGKDNPAFARNIVNRLWFVLMGRGLVQPLDLHHGANPPSHPELLDLLATEFVAHDYDLKWMLRELALTETYQRSSEHANDGKPADPSRFVVAAQRRLSAEQLLRSVLTATGETSVKNGGTFEKYRKLFRDAFANQPREPEEEFNPSLKAALFLLNDKTVLGWIEPKPGNLLDRLAGLDDISAAEEAYLHVLSRQPTAEEADAIVTLLSRDTERRPAALRNLVWALLASTEFQVNH